MNTQESAQEDGNEVPPGAQPPEIVSPENNRDDSRPSGSGLDLFDPSSLSSGDVHVFEAPQIINEYVEKHFCAVLDKETRENMFKAHPVPSTPVMKVPNVDEFMLSHLRARFPRSNEAQLRTIQMALLSAAGPLTCLWANLIANDMVHEGATVSVEDVLQVIQRSLVLMGNANTLLANTQRDSILQVVNKSLVKYSKDCKPGIGEHLFGKNFPVALKKEVEQDKSLSQIVALTHRHHLYDRPRQPTREPTLGHSGKQFFPKGPAGRQGFQ